MSIGAILFSLVLALAAAVAWILASSLRAQARLYVRFSATLYLALAIAGLVPESGEATGEFARAVALVVCVLAPSMLALALVGLFAKPPSPLVAGLFLPLACLGGIAAAATDVTAFGFAPLALIAGAALVFSLRALRKFGVAAAQGAAATVAFLCAASSLMVSGEAARAALDLFSATGLLGAVLALLRGSNPPVEKKKRSKSLSRVLAVGDRR
jgi:hypothetical protein